MKKRIFVTAFLLFLLIACTEQKNQIQRYYGKALGTSYSIQFFYPNEQKLSPGIDSVFQAVNASISTYRENSVISKINRGERVKVDSIFTKVFLLSQDIYRKTNGYFDPTVGQLVNAYGFGPEKPTKTQSEIPYHRLMQSSGLDKVAIDGKGYVQKSNDSIYLDFNAIGKGYAVDALGDFLKQRQIENFLIEVGGEVLANGKNLRDDQAWKVGIDSPENSKSSHELNGVIKLKNSALATSGNYRKFKIDSVTGERFVHTVNPKTGKALKSNLLSVSVMADRCAVADAYATAFMAMGFTKAKKIAENRNDIEVYFIYSKNKKSKTYASEGFEMEAGS